jgi:hypothetical protein
MKQNSFYFSILLILFGCNACNKDNSTQLVNGVAVSLPHLWVLQTRTDNTSTTGGSVLSSIVYNGNVLVSGLKNGDNSLIMINSQTGEKIWEWQDWIERNSGVSVHKPFIKNNLLFFQKAYWNYCIDLNTGKTVFKNVFNEGYSGYAYGLGDYLYTSLQYYRNRTPVYPREGSTIYQSSIKNGLMLEITIPRYDSSGLKSSDVEAGGIAGVAPYLLNNDTMLAVGFGDIPKEGWTQCLGVYNVTQKKWVAEREVISQNQSHGLDQEPQIWQNKIYLCGAGFITCYDAVSGKYIWRVSINGNFLFSGFIIQNGKIYANDSFGNLHCIDAVTSKEYWVEPTSGTSSDIVYLDGVVYLVGGGDGLLHAIDAETGTTLWKVKSPDASKYNDGNFDRFCAAVPGSFGSKGRVVVSSGYNAYCYEAAK